MNALIVGANKTTILDHLPEGDFLMIDDGPIIEKLRYRGRKFDVLRNSFNPLKDLSYRTAREFVAVLNAVFPEGENTLTKANTRFQLLRALTGTKHERLSTLISDTKETHDAYQTLQTLLLSPVLRRVIDNPRRRDFAFTGTITAWLDRALLGDFDAFVLGNLLISQYPGPIVIPDFGFYALPAHSTLIRQDRLIAGLNTFDEVPELKNLLLQMETKVGRRCAPEDAELLARYSGFKRDAHGYSNFIEQCIA
jgi:hypothetical protein